MKTTKIKVELDIFDDPEFCGSLDGVCERRFWDEAGLQFFCGVFNKLLGDGIEKCDKCKEAWSESKKVWYTVDDDGKKHFEAKRKEEENDFFWEDIMKKKQGCLP